MTSEAILRTHVHNPRLQPFVMPGAFHSAKRSGLQVSKRLAAEVNSIFRLTATEQILKQTRSIYEFSTQTEITRPTYVG